MWEQIIPLFKINMYIQLKKSNKQEEEPVKVKISGDGARMSHSSSLFVCSFAILNEGQHVLSSTGRCTTSQLFLVLRGVL